MEEHEDEVDHPEVVGQPEEFEDSTTGILQGEGIDDGAEDDEKNAGKTWEIKTRKTSTPIQYHVLSYFTTVHDRETSR